MRRESGNEMDHLMEGIADDLQDRRHKGQSMRDESFIDFKRRLIYWGAGIFVFLLLFVLFFGGGGSQEELRDISGRLAQIDKRLERFTDIEQRITQVEKQLSKLGKDFYRLEKAVKTASRTAAGGRAASQAGGGRLYHTVQPGENLYLIAKQYDISIAEICRFNQITPKKVIQPGQKLWIEPASD